MHKITLLIFFAIAQALFGITYDTSASAVCGNLTTACTSGTTLTYALTVGAGGTNRGLAVVVCVSAGSADVQPAISSVTYAGVSLSQKQHTGGNYYCDIWTLGNGVQPATGANNVVVTLASSIVGSFPRLSSGAVSLTGVNQTNAWVTTNGNSATTGTSATVTLASSAAADYVVYGVCSGTADNSTATGTERWDYDNLNGACLSFSGATAAGGTTSLSWAITDDRWIIVGGALRDTTSAIAGAKVRHRVMGQ